jgi:hypothetical protein
MFSPGLNCLRKALSAIKAQSFAVRKTNPFLAVDKIDTSGVAFDMVRCSSSKKACERSEKQQGKKRLAEKPSA